MADDDGDFLEWEEWRPEDGSFVSHMVAGSMAGIAEHTLVFPVDTLKTHVQCDRCGKLAQPGGSDTGCIHALRTMIRTQGYQRLWRGVSSMFVACIPAHACYFSIYEFMKESLGANQPGHHPLAAAVSGMAAGLAHDSIMTPMDTVKQRLQLGYYRGIRHCMQRIVASEGVGALYVALPTTLIMNLPFSAIMVTSNESLKKLLNGGKQGTTMTYLTAASISGAIAAAATTPLDMIKTRLQTQHMASSAQTASLYPNASTTTPWSNSSLSRRSLKYTCYQLRNTMTSASPSGDGQRLTGISDAMRTIYMEGGMRGFMRGFIPRILVTTPSVAISWTAYESFKAVLISYNI